MVIQEKLKEFFQNKGLTNRVVGKRIGYSDTMVGRYLNNKKPKIRYHTRQQNSS